MRPIEKPIRCTRCGMKADGVQELVYIFNSGNKDNSYICESCKTIDEYIEDEVEAAFNDYYESGAHV